MTRAPRFSAVAPFRGVYSLFVALSLAACQARAAPPADGVKANASPAPKPVSSEVVNRTGPNGASDTVEPKSEQVKGGSVSPDTYSDLIDTLAKRDTMSLTPADVEVRFGRFAPLKRSQPVPSAVVLSGGGPRESIEITFTESETRGNWRCATVELKFYAKNASDSKALYDALRRQLRAKLGNHKHKYKSAPDDSLPSFNWIVTPGIVLELTETALGQSSPGERVVRITVDEPQGEGE
jgi:hypothetical protein